MYSMYCTTQSGVECIVATREGSGSGSSILLCWWLHRRLCQNIKEHIWRNCLALGAESRQGICCFVLPAVHMVHLITDKEVGLSVPLSSISRHHGIFRIPCS